MLQLLFFYVAWWMLHENVNVAVGIFHPRIGYRNHHLYTYFFILQALISNVIIIIYQYYDEPSYKKKTDRTSGGDSSTEKKNYLATPATSLRC
jgi:hypothetical protein